jgi:hypothetical protein
MELQRWRRPSYATWNVVALTLLGLYLAGLVMLCLAVLAPRLVIALRPVKAYANPSAWWPILVQILLGTLAFLAYYGPRRNQTRSFSLLVTAGLAFTTISLGLVSYWHCAGGQSPFFTPLTWALGLIVGSVADPFGTTSGCPTGYPLAVQIARLFGPLLLVIAALGIVTTVFQAQNDRLRVRFASSLVILVGLSEDALGLLRRLAGGLGRRTTLAVLVRDPGNPQLKVARDIGARVVTCDLDDPVALPSLLTSKGKFKVRTLYAVSADVSENLKWAAQFRAVADSTKINSFDLPPRMIVRIDEPWQAEYWRRTNAYRTAEPGKSTSIRWMSDALSVYEVTAARILDRILTGDHDRLVIAGISPLALAVCAEMSHREREGRMLGKKPVPSFSELVLFGPEAEVLRQQHRLRQERFGNAADSSEILVVSQQPTSFNLQRVLENDQRPAVILADDPAESTTQLATFLAAQHPHWTLFDWSPATRGVSPEPLMELLYPFGLTMEAPSEWPVDSWERAARIAHQRYLRVHVPKPDPQVASHRSWNDGLNAFLKDSNVRLITTTLASAETVGRSWGPGTDTGSAPNEPLSADQLEEMAKLEHASWLKYHLDNGWQQGSPRDDRRRVHPALVPWPALSRADQEKTRRNVLDALETLEGLGYRSVGPAATASPSTVLAESANRSRPERHTEPEEESVSTQETGPTEGTGPTVQTGRTEGWRAVARKGAVTAARSDRDWTWTNRAGETMHAKAGDWRVVAPDGDSWSVTADIFAKTYEHEEGDRWQRTGTVRARPALPGEVISSLEGQQTAAAGDWVIRGSQDELWITSAEHFAANYEPAAEIASGPAEPATSSGSINRGT